jgi:outer membrane protein OmpA-like peptidoglycan-associated protein
LSFQTSTNFKYEKLDDEGYFISTVDEGEFSYVITFESKKNALDASTQLSSLLMGYNVVETYDPQTGTYRYQLDVGKELAEAIMLSNDLQNASVYIVSIEKLNYDPLTDEEFYLIPVEEGTEQFILVLGKYEEKQNIYKTFSHVRPFEEIREIYNAEDGVYTYIIGGYASLDEAYAAMENVKGIGLSNVYIRKFIYSPIDSDKFTLEEVNDELELYRLSVYKGNKKVSAGDPRFDGIREHGRLIDSYDPERDVFVVSLGGTKSLPKALNNLGAVLKQMDDSVSVERYIYSSFDKDRFAIREVDKKDEFYGIEILESEQPLPEDNEILKKLQRKYPIVSKYDEESHSYKYYIANINNYEGAQKYLEYAQQDGFVEAKIVIIVYETLGLEEFYIQPVEEEAFDYVINVLRTRSDLDLDDPYFADLPPDLKIDKIFDEKTGTYNYVVFSPPDINEANKILSAVKEAGYLFVHIDRMEYEPINPDLFQLVPIQESEEDFAVTLFRSKQQLGADHPRFDQIRQFGEIKEYYDNNTNEYIYSFGKAVGFKQAFRNMVIAKENGFEQATIGKFVYSDLNPDHFYLESIDHYEEMFTVILAESSERINSERFEAFESQGFIVREKYIESRGLWVYSLSMTKNVAEAENMATFAKEAGFENAKLSRFIYSPLSTDYYYLKSIDNDEELFMIVLKESEQQLDVNNDPYFANLTGKYPIKEVYDKERKIYKYYVGGSLKDLAYAESLQKELYALGYSEVTIVQFKFSALHFDEFYIQYIDDSGEVVFLFEKDKIVKLITVYFGFDQYYLDKKSRLQIDTLVQKFRGINFRILLEGRTDDIGESEYNKWLGHKRAESVKKYLLQYGISEERIKVVSLGEKDPIAPNINLENRRKNRSVRIIPEIP